MHKDIQTHPSLISAPKFKFSQLFYKHKCIPVWCVHPLQWPSLPGVSACGSGGGGVCLRVLGGSACGCWRGICLWVRGGGLPVGLGVCLPLGPGGSISGSRGCLSLGPGVSASGPVGCLPHPLDIYPQTLCPGGVYASGSGRVSTSGCLDTYPQTLGPGGCLPLGLGGVSASGSGRGVCLWVRGGCLPLGLGCVYHNPWTPPPGHRPPSPQPPFHPLIEWLTDRCKNITMPQTSFAGGKDVTFICCEFTISCPFRTDKRVSHYHWRKCQVTIVLSH